MTADARTGGPGQGPEDAARELARLREREAYFARALGVADGGRFRADWDGAMRRLIAERDALAGVAREALDLARRLAEGRAAPARGAETARLRETVKALYRHAMGDGVRAIDDAMRHGREVCEEDAGAGPPDEE